MLHSGVNMLTSVNIPLTAAELYTYLQVVEMEGKCLGEKGGIGGMPLGGRRGSLYFEKCGGSWLCLGVC